MKGKKVSNVIFSVREKGFSLFFTNSGISYVIYKSKVAGENTPILNKYKKENRLIDRSIEYARIDMELVNGYINRDNIVYEGELAGYTNYYLAHCPEGIKGVKSYSRVRVKEVYPGIDWVFRYDEEGRLHHEFEIKSGADWSQIRFKVKWADIELASGSKQLILSTPIGKISDGIIQGQSGSKSLEVRYKLDGGNIGYEVTGWDGVEKLIIDPPLALLWSTFYGGNLDDLSNFLTTDGSGNLFVCGATLSDNFPTQNAGGGSYFQGSLSGIGDAFILKFNSNGVRQWATYYGGLLTDAAFSVTADGSGNIFVCGYTISITFPTQNPGGGAYYQSMNAGVGDAFILKFNNSGVRQWATLYGGGGDDNSWFVKTDGSGNLLMTGETLSDNFPTQNPGGGAYYQGNKAGVGDVYILKFNNSGVRQWATYYGGESDDWGRAISADGSGNIFVSGYTSSTSFPIQNAGGGSYYQSSFAGSEDAFILKFNSSGVRQWATYYGGNDYDGARGHTIDGSGNLFVSGYTSSTDFPTQNLGGGAYFQNSVGGYQDAFILKFNNNGVRQWATYYGGSDADGAFSIALDGSGNLYITGGTISANFPIHNPGGGAYFQQANAGLEDIFILRFSSGGVRQWATYFGGGLNEHSLSIATDGNGNSYVSGVTKSSNFPLLNPGGGAYFQSSGGGTYFDVFILKFQGGNIGIKPISTEIPKQFALYQNYPNPFNSSTKIEFDLPENNYVVIKLYDITGKEVSTLVNEYLKAGKYVVDFNSYNLSSGIYVYKMISGNYMKTNKMVLAK